MTNRIEPAEASAMIESATGLKIPTRRLLYWARHGSFPAPATDVHPKMIFFRRSDVAEWIKQHFADDAANATRDKLESARAPRRRA